MNRQPRAHRMVSLALAIAAMLVLAPAGVAQESARAAYDSGRRASAKDLRQRYFAKGMELAQGRLAVRPDDAEGLYWLAVNMGAHALERGKMSALPVVPRMEALLLRLDQVEPSYEEAGAARVLGRLYHQAPALISIGSNKKAGQFLAKAVRLAPNHAGNLAFAADFLATHGDRSLARAYASRCLATLAGQPLGPEQTEWAALARGVMEETR